MESAPQPPSSVAAVSAAAATVASTTRRPVDARALDRTLRRLSLAPSAPWLHGEVARRMADRLALIKSRPAVVLDWSARLGGGRQPVEAAYARLGARPEILSVEPFPVGDAAAAHGGAAWWSPSRWRRPPQLLSPAQVQPGSAQLLWSNMSLHAQSDPAVVIAQWHRALALDGFLMFSALGPGTLPELRALYAAQRWGAPMAPLVDMHDLGDMLVRAGFADPVMDQELIELSWPNAQAALSELRSLGANVDPVRFGGLRTPRWKDRLLEVLADGARQAPDGRIRLSFEVAYGHAFRPAAKVPVAPEARVDLADFRAMTREPRR